MNKSKRIWAVAVIILFVFEFFLQLNGAVSIISLFIFLLAGFLIPFIIFKKVYSNAKEKNLKLFFTLYAIINFPFFVFAILEFGLRIAGLHNDRGGTFVYAMRGYDPYDSWFLTNDPNLSNESTYHCDEFEYEISTNSMGFRDTEWQKKKDDRVRVIALGDSFTEGVGSPADSTWPKLLQALMDDSLEVLNAGIQASDPFFSFMLLKEKLLAYQPDLVIMMVNSTDIDDIMVRSGNERFRIIDGDSVCVNKPDPWWIRIYGMSFTFRYIIHDVLDYDYYFKRPDELKREQKISRDKMLFILQEFEKLSLEHRFKFVTIILPMKWELLNNSFNCMTFVLGNDFLPGRTQLIDLCIEMKTGCPDKTMDELYWSADGHMKPEGNLCIAKLLARKIDFSEVR